MILFYDDELDTLEEEFEYLKHKLINVQGFNNADELIPFYEANHDSIQGIVIDIMVFGPGNSINPHLDDSGFESGYALIIELDKIDQLKNGKIPKKFVYTNRTKPELLAKLNEDIRISTVRNKNSQFYDEYIEEVLNKLQS